MEYNPNIAYISAYAGAGGEDAKDWARMLVVMYKKYAFRKKWRVRLLSELELEIKGEMAYDTLKREAGVHRLVRISPFNAKKLRHTSFARIEVLPELSRILASELQIPEKDLKISFYRSSGPGGQNVNKVETAVRINHIPTGVVASSESERSQARNREQALNLLKARLAKFMEDRKEKELTNLKTKISPEWGHEIRSYVLHPYKQVKDHRTGLKISKVEEVLDGNLDLLLK